MPLLRVASFKNKVENSENVKTGAAGTATGYTVQLSREVIIKCLACAMSFLAASEWRYSPILGAAVPLFEEAGELQTSGWFNANIRGVSKGQYVFLQQSVNTDYGSHEGTLCLVNTDH